MLNPALKIDDLAATYARDKRVLIDNVLVPDIAEEIHAILNGPLAYDLLFFIDGANRIASQDQLKSLNNEQRQELQQKIQQQAREGVGFLYCGYRMEGEKLASAPGALKRLFEYVRGDEMMGAIRRITGESDIASATGQYTRYESGHFLTRHSDDITAEGRTVAYVLNLSKSWHPDWGGLLQFYANDGSPLDAWAPGFNRLALFDVSHIHSVTYVAPFAKSPRLALTGWFSQRA